MLTQPGPRCLRRSMSWHRRCPGKLVWHFELCSLKTFEIHFRSGKGVKHRKSNPCPWFTSILTLYLDLPILGSSNFSFSHNVFKSCLLLMRQNEYLWSKGLRNVHFSNNLFLKIFTSNSHNLLGL